MKILEKEFEFDFYDADIMEKIETGMEKVENVVKKESDIKNQKTSIIIRKICNTIFEFFDNVLGEGASKKIFGDKSSLTLCINAYGDFVNEKKKQDAQLEEISKKYSPNRATRRARK